MSRVEASQMASRKITEFFEAPPKRLRPDSSAESSSSTDYRPASFSEVRPLPVRLRNRRIFM